ncbi:MAG: alpha/beta hydrolase-fold protein [Kofleriaceae bacterium]
MRWIVCVLAACSSGSNSSPLATPPVHVGSSAPIAVRPAGPLPPADRLEAGHPIDKTIKGGEVHRYRVELPAGGVFTGVVMQDGIDVSVVTFDPAGTKIAEYDSPNGMKGPEPIVIEATAAGAYDFEVRPFVEPGANAGAAQPTGRYTAQLDEIITGLVYAERKAAKRIASPRILAVWNAARARHTAEVASFWTDLKGKAPIVEPYPGHADEVLVSFVTRATTPYVAMIGGTDFREKPMVRIPDTELWYLTVRMPADSRFDYAFIAADGPADYLSPFQPRGNDPRFAKKATDPNNPRTHFDMSRAELPAAPPQPWIVAKPEVPKGKLEERKLESAVLKESRRIGIYTPAGYDPKQTYPLLIVFDGEVYGLEPGALMPTPTILDNLIAAKKIPAMVAVLVASQGVRDRDLPGSLPFSQFVATELVPKLRADFHAGLTPAQTIITGSSFGGLCSTFTAFHHSDVIGNVLSQSGSYQWRPGTFDTDLPLSDEPGVLVREIAKSPKLPIRFYLDAGRFEQDLLALNRQMRDVLVAKGYPVTYAEYSGGHDYELWRGTIADGVIALTAK